MGMFDFIESALTPAGTNARRGQEEQIRAFADMLQRLGMGREQSLNSLFGLQDQQLANLSNLFSEGAREGRVTAFGNQANENAAKASRNASLAMRASGAGDGFQAGASSGAFGDAARQTNAYRAYEYSPEKRGQELQQVMGIGGNQLQQLLALFGGVNGQQPVQVQPGLGQTIGQLGSMWASKGFK